MRRLMRAVAVAPPPSLRLATSAAGRTCAAVPSRTGRLLSVQQRGFASQTGEAAGSHEDLKRDFARWARKELQLLAMLALAGGAGVYFYRVR